MLLECTYSYIYSSQQKRDDPADLIRSCTTRTQMNFAFHHEKNSLYLAYQKIAWLNSYLASKNIFFSILHWTHFCALYIQTQYCRYIFKLLTPFSRAATMPHRGNILLHRFFFTIPLFFYIRFVASTFSGRRIFLWQYNLFCTILCTYVCEPAWVCIFGTIKMIMVHVKVLP